MISYKSKMMRSLAAGRLFELPAILLFFVSFFMVSLTWAKAPEGHFKFSNFITGSIDTVVLQELNSQANEIFPNNENFGSHVIVDNKINETLKNYENSVKYQALMKDIETVLDSGVVIVDQYSFSYENYTDSTSFGSRNEDLEAEFSNIKNINPVLQKAIYDVMIRSAKEYTATASSVSAIRTKGLILAAIPGVNVIAAIAGNNTAEKVRDQATAFDLLQACALKNFIGQEVPQLQTTCQQVDGTLVRQYRLFAAASLLQLILGNVSMNRSHGRVDINSASFVLSRIMEINQHFTEKGLNCGAGGAFLMGYGTALLGL